MKTLYDLLGARPDDDAEGLKAAFHKAAKASRSGFHTGHPDAPKRFRQIVEAYDILRNAERRAAYDRLLEFDRTGLRAKLERAISYLVHNIISDAIGVVGLVVVLAGGHTFSTYISKAPMNAFDATTRGPAEVADIRSEAGTGVTEPVEPRDKLERVAVAETPTMMPNADALAANGGSALEAAESVLGPSSAGLGIEVAKTNNTFAAPADQNQARLDKVPFSCEKRDDDVPTASPSDVAKSENKHDFEIPTRDASANNMRMPDAKITGKSRVEARRQAKNRSPVKQASLEDRRTSACPGHQACSGEPPVFGIGF